MKSGTAPSAVTVGITPSALPGGGSDRRVISSVRFHLPAAGGSVTVPVSVTVGTECLHSTKSDLFDHAGRWRESAATRCSMFPAQDRRIIHLVPAVYTGTGGAWLNISNKGGELLHDSGGGHDECECVDVDGGNLYRRSRHHSNISRITSGSDCAGCAQRVEAPGTPYFRDSVPGELSFFRTTTETPCHRRSSRSVMRGRERSTGRRPLPPRMAVHG